MDYKLLTTCYPYETVQAQETLDFCSANEGNLCGLTHLLVGDMENFNSAIGCFLYFSKGSCLDGCRGILTRLIDDIGCCANNFFRLRFPWINSTEVYETCGVEDPGFCPNPFEAQGQFIQKRHLWRCGATGL